MDFSFPVITEILSTPILYKFVIKDHLTLLCLLSVVTLNAVSVSAFLNISIWKKILQFSLCMEEPERPIVPSFGAFYISHPRSCCFVVISIAKEIVFGSIYGTFCGSQNRYFQIAFRE